VLASALLLRSSPLLLTGTFVAVAVVAVVGSLVSVAVVAVVETLVTLLGRWATVPFGLS
jgi:hypothetical protein